MTLIKDYYTLTKPGIIYGNSVTVLGGYFLGSQAHFHFLSFLLTFIGMALIIACGCVLNNYIDRDIDRLMARTKNRPSVRGVISVRSAMIYATILGVSGAFILGYWVNILTLLIALFGLFIYVVLYSLWFKRRSQFGTAVGAISGAIPPVVGYCAATNNLDMGAGILFLILYFWQMPHFFAITIFRIKDYSVAKIPVLSVNKGIYHTKVRMLAYIVPFTVAAAMPAVLGYAGLLYLIVALGIGVAWFCLGIRGFAAQSDVIWSRKMFMFSVMNIMILCLMMSVT